MEVVLAGSSSRMKAELRLAQAVSQFEADLPSDQKAEFKSHRASALQALPSIDDVMHATAEVDRQAAQNGRGVRCFGPRLTNVLQAAQRFAAIGDILVGASQNFIACGVWTAVRSTLLLVSGFSSHLEKISLLFMEIGRSAPRYQDLSLLYPHSKKLQSYLAEYFILVVGLCHRLVKFTQKSRLGQLATSLSDPEMKTTQSDLELWANSIREEVNFIMHQRIHEVSETTSALRLLSKGSSDERARRKRLLATLRVLDSCTTYDYQSTWKQTRKIGNTALFSRYTQYADWKSRTSSGTLICAGKLGCGKSVLLANVVDDLTLTVGARNTALAYFFCRYDTSQSLEARTIIGSIVRQVLEKLHNGMEAAPGAEANSSARDLDIEDLLALLVNNIAPYARLFIVLDGLDECPEEDRSAVLTTLRKAQKACSILVLVSIRLEAGRALSQASNQLVEPTTVHLSEENPEIRDFIDAQLVSYVESGRLVLGDASLVLDIRDSLISKADGMFLWAALQIDALCTKTTDREIREALSNLPRGLPATFRRILGQLDISQARNEAHQARILQIISVARRPLTTEELREALSVVPGTTAWDQKSVVNDIYSMLSSCGSLIMVDEEDLTVRLVHHSVQKFLFEEQVDLAGESFTEATANHHFAAVIVTYLNYGAFDRRVSRMVTPKLFADSAPTTIIRSAIACSTQTRKLALKLLRSPKKSNADVGKILADAGRFYTDSSTPHHLFPYARKYLLYHLRPALEHEEWVYKMLANILQKDYLPTKAINGRTPLGYFSELGSTAAVKHLLSSGLNVNETDELYGRTPLHWAALAGQEGVVRFLLAVNGIDVGALDAKSSHPASLWAASRGHFDIEELISPPIGRTPTHGRKSIKVQVVTNDLPRPVHGAGLARIFCAISEACDVAEMTRKAFKCFQLSTASPQVAKKTLRKPKSHSVVVTDETESEVWLLGDADTSKQPVKVEDHSRSVWEICRAHTECYETRFWIGGPRHIGHDLPHDRNCGYVLVFLKELNGTDQHARGAFCVPGNQRLWDVGNYMRSMGYPSTDNRSPERLVGVWKELPNGLLSTSLDPSWTVTEHMILDGTILWFKYSWFGTETKEMFQDEFISNRHKIQEKFSENRHHYDSWGRKSDTETTPSVWDLDEVA